MAESDFPRPYIIGMAPRLPDADQISLRLAGRGTLPVPCNELPHMPGSSTTPGPPGARACAPVCIAFRLRNGVSTRDMNLCGAQWLAYVLLCRRFAAAFAGDRARLVVDVDRYSFSYRACTDYSLPVSRRTAKDSGTSSRQRTSRNRRASAARTVALRARR
jgi:hypothetical protein